LQYPKRINPRAQINEGRKEKENKRKKEKERKNDTLICPCSLHHFSTLLPPSSLFIF
jgi:hypothetical protein